MALSTPFDGNTIVCGMERSGSTFVYQVVKELGTNVSKTHAYEQGSPHSLKIYTIRDPRDVICSYARTWVAAQFDVIPEHEAEEWKDASFQESLRVAAHKLFYSPAARQLDYRCYRWEAEQGGHVVFIRYEDYFLGNEKLLVRQLADMLSAFNNRDITDNEVEQIVQKFSIDKNRERSKAIPTFLEWDEETQVHGNHISNNGKSSWRNDFTFDIACHVDKYLGDFIIELGYEPDRSWKFLFE